MATDPASPSRRAAKKKVANRLGMTGGGIQRANQTISSGSTVTDASSAASLTAAAAAVASSSGLPFSSRTSSASSMRPPGNTHMPPKAIFEFLWSIRVSRPSGVSLRTMTVAAGMSSVEPCSSWCLA